MLWRLFFKIQKDSSQVIGLPVLTVIDHHILRTHSLDIDRDSRGTDCVSTPLVDHLLRVTAEYGPISTLTPQSHTTASKTLIFHEPE